MNAFKKLMLGTISTVLGLALVSCGGGGGSGGGGGGGGGGHPAPTVITGTVVDGFVAGATVTAYKVNADGTKGAQIGSPVMTDQLGNYALNLGTYTGPVYLTSQGGTYVDAATGKTISLSTSLLILSSIVPNASGNVTAEINPLTTMAANVALTLASQGNEVATAATGANGSVSNYFGLSNNILTTALLDLTKANCMTGGASQQSADVSAILAGISQLAKDTGVSPPDLIQALVQDVMRDGLFDGSDSGTTISVFSSATGTTQLSAIEGTGLTGLASAITSFMTNTTSSNVCNATVDTGVISALSYTNIFATPPAPTGVQATSKYAAAIVSWNTVTVATSYNIYLAKQTGVTPTSTQLPGFRSIKNVTSPSVISSGLASATYYFVVTAVSGTSPFAGYESAPSAEASTTVTASAQWARSVTAGSNPSLFNGVSASASDGSVYTAGSIAGTSAYSFGNGISATGAYSGNNASLVKYDSSGLAQWARTVAGTGIGDSQFMSVSAAPDGSVYAAGFITGTATYNFGNNITATGAFLGTFNSDNLVLVKYDSAGNAQWARTVTGTGISYSTFNSVAVASDGSVYAAGYIGAGTYDFGNGKTVTGLGSVYAFNIVLVKYDGSGNAQWAKTVTAGSSYSYFYSVAAASDGSVYAAGYISGAGTYTFDPGVSTAGTNSNGDNIVLVKYSSSGTAQWARSVTAGSDQSVLESVSVAPDGSAVYAAGYVTGTGTYNFGNSKTVTGAFTGFNPVLVKYDSTGLALWATSVTAGSSGSNFSGVSAAPDGSVYAAGSIDGTGTYNFGNGVIAEGTSVSSLVMVKYDSTGLAQWAQTAAGGNGQSFFNGVSAAPDNTVYAAGGIFGTGTYDLGNDVTAAGTYLNGYNTVLVKYNGFGSILMSW